MRGYLDIEFWKLKINCPVTPWTAAILYLTTVFGIVLILWISLVQAKEANIAAAGTFFGHKPVATVPYKTSPPEECPPCPTIEEEKR